MIIDADDDDGIIEMELSTLHRDRSPAKIVSLSFVLVELVVWMMVINHAVKSIMFAKTADEILGDGLAVIFINEIDNLAYNLLVPDRVRNMQAKQLFRFDDWPSDEIINLREDETLSLVERLSLVRCTELYTLLLGLFSH